MPANLPEPIAAYIAAENHGDPQSVARCFAKDAIVHDEGQTHRGMAAIGRWSAATRQKYAHRIEPLSCVEEGDAYRVLNRLAGTFPGSPIELEFVFRLTGGKITELEIRS